MYNLKVVRRVLLEFLLVLILKKFTNIFRLSPQIDVLMKNVNNAHHQNCNLFFFTAITKSKKNQTSILLCQSVPSSKMKKLVATTISRSVFCSLQCSTCTRCPTHVWSLEEDHRYNRLTDSYPGMIQLLEVLIHLYDHAHLTINEKEFKWA